MFHGTLTSQAFPQAGAHAMRRWISAQEPSMECLARWEDDGGRANGRLHRAPVRQPASVGAD